MRIEDLPNMKVLGPEFLTNQQFLTFSLSPIQSLILVGNLQLSLSHPENRGPTVAMARLMADDIANSLKRAYPQLSALIDAGWPENRPKS